MIIILKNKFKKKSINYSFLIKNQYKPSGGSLIVESSLENECVESPKLTSQSAAAFASLQKCCT